MTIQAISTENLPIIAFQNVPVVTTELLAQLYGTDIVRVRQNHHENKTRFVEGKHFFKVTGEELKSFASSLKLLTNPPIEVSSKTRSLILWTERGAARHAKMLDTDQAWDVFEKLEDCYFTKKPQEQLKLNDGYHFVIAKDGVPIYQQVLSTDCNKLTTKTLRSKKLLLEHIREVVGEFIGKDALPAPQPQLAISYPVKAAKPPKGGIGNQHYFKATDFVDGRFDPIRDFLDDLERAGYEVAGLKIINIAKTWIIKEQHQDLAHLNQLSSRFLSQLGEFHQQQKNISTKGMSVCWLNPDIMQIVQKYQ